MDFNAAWTDIAPPMFRALGGVTIQAVRPRTLATVRPNVAAAGPPLELAADAAAGATAITLRAVGSHALRGALPQGQPLVIAGQSVALAAAAAADGGVTIAATIAPALSANRSAGTAVTASGEALLTYEDVLIEEESELPTQQLSGASRGVRLSIPVAGAPAEPGPDWTFVLPGGRRVKARSEPVLAAGWWSFGAGSA